MNASKFLDKQIMDLSRSSKTTDLNTNNNTTTDFMDLMNPQSEEEQQVDINVGSSSLKNNDEILPNYDFQPIHRPVAALQSDPPTPPPPSSRVFNSLDSKHNSATLRSYNSVDHAEPDRLIPEKTQRADDSAILSEIDGTIKRYIDNVLHAMDGVSARLTQLESRTRYLEDSVDELKVSIGNNHGSADGKMRQLENILLQVQSGVQDLKDKQDVMEGHMQLAKLQISKAEKSSELSTTTAHDSMQQNAASAPPQQPGIQFSIPAPQQVPSVPPNASLSSQQNIYPPPATPQYPSGPTQPVPQRDPYFTQPSQAQEPHSQQYQMPPPAPHQQQPLNPAQEAQTQQYQIPPPSQHQHQQQPHTPAPPPQQYPSTPVPPYSQPPQPPQQQHPTVVGANSAPVPPSGYRAEEGPYMPPQTYPPNLHQSAPQPNSMPPQSQPYYGSPPNMYEPPSTGRSSSGFPSPYGPPSGPGEQYTYGGPASQYSSGSSIKAQPHSPVGSNSNYPQLPTARILPPSIPSAAGINGGSSSGGSGNKVPIDDVVEKVTNMGFPKDVVRATVRKLTENGQSVDLNVVLDKLMNDGDAQSQRGWFGR